MSLSRLVDFHFPSDKKNHYDDNLKVYWYSQEFSQSRYPPGQKASTACTLICLLVAQQISQTGLLICNVEKCQEITVIIADAIVEGNSILEWIVKKRLVSHPFLGIEEALKFGGKSLSLLKEWTFQVFSKGIEKGLYKYMNKFLQKWYTAPRSKNLFMLLITSGRTVLFIFQEKTHMVTFFDSHCHITTENPNRGLVIAQTTIDKLELLCNWYIEDIFNKYCCTKSKNYELACLYPCNLACCCCNPLCNCSSQSLEKA